MENKVDDFAKVEPKEFFITLLGKKRQIKFGNLALAKIERKYGSVTNFTKLEKDMQEKPMQNFPWLLSICLKDKEGIDESEDGILQAMDDSNVTISEVMNVISEAMQSSFSNMFPEEKKTQKIMKK